jgi:hypothetical protein
MIKKITWLLFVLVSISVSAQIKGVVVDENNQPIPYVNIWVLNENIGTTTEDDGSFKIDLKDDNKDLIFSAIGFETKILKPIETKIVILKSTSIELEDVVINKKTSKEEKEIGYYESGGFRYHMAYFVDGILFKVAKEELEKFPFVKELKFKTLSKIQNAKIRLYLVEINNDGSPSDQLLMDDLIIEVKKGSRKNIIDLSAKKIAIPENGFYIVFEKLKIEENKYYFEYEYENRDGNKIKSKGLQYQPEIPLSPVKVEIGWHKRINNKWEKNEKIILQNPNSYENLLMKKYHNNYLVPSVNITISN